LKPKKCITTHIQISLIISQERIDCEKLFGRYLLKLKLRQPIGRKIGQKFQVVACKPLSKEVRYYVGFCIKRLTALQHFRLTKMKEKNNNFKHIENNVLTNAKSNSMSFLNLLIMLHGPFNPAFV
jgi:hypothetical protein